jgi:hypothetical protein
VWVYSGLYAAETIFLGATGRFPRLETGVKMKDFATPERGVFILLFEL